MQTANKVDSLTWNGSYRFLNRGGVSVAMLSAAKGGITATNPSQWASFTRDIDAANNSTIVLVMDKTPSAFSSAAETNYFRAILSKYVEQGKKVFVISCGRRLTGPPQRTACATSTCPIFGRQTGR